MSVKEEFTFDEIRALAYPDVTARYESELHAQLVRLRELGIIEAPFPFPAYVGREHTTWRIPGGLSGFDRWCELCAAADAADRLVKQDGSKEERWGTVVSAVIGSDGTAYARATQRDVGGVGCSEIVIKLHGSPGVVVPAGTSIDVGRHTFFARNRVIEANE